MRYLFALFLFMSLMTGLAMAKDEVTLYGYVEKAVLVDKNLKLSAKLDTGAKSASLNATDIQHVKIKGDSYLRFSVPTKDGNVVFEAKYIGKVKIKFREQESHLVAVESTSMRRPVILLNVQLGEKVQAIPVNLTNRKRFLYPLLLGRDAIIKFNGAVNPALTFVTSKGSETS